MVLTIPTIQDHHLLNKIGGEAALEQAVEVFYEKLVSDPTLLRFFENVNLDKLKLHQRKFLAVALTEFPKDLDVASLIREKHHRLFALGLNETHFDKVASHLVATLQGLQVSESLIDEIVSVIAPLRSVFETGKKEHLLDKIGGMAALEAAVDLFYEKILADDELAPFFAKTNMARLKEHQRNFLSLALTEVPEDVNVPEIILIKHSRLFCMGLNETHFDKVAGHLVASLEGLQLRNDYIDEIVAIVVPLRAVFEQGAKEYRENNEEENKLQN
jgi:hemoglobin